MLKPVCPLIDEETELWGAQGRAWVPQSIGGTGSSRIRAQVLGERLER